VAQVAEGVASLFADRSKQAEVDAFLGQFQVGWEGWTGSKLRELPNKSCQLAASTIHHASCCNLTSALTTTHPPLFNWQQDQQLDPGYAARAKESIAANAAWLDQHGEQACSWVSQQRSASGG
jgi:hypothetical protein